MHLAICKIFRSIDNEEEIFGRIGHLSNICHIYARISLEPIKHISTEICSSSNSFYLQSYLFYCILDFYTLKQEEMGKYIISVKINGNTIL